LRVHQCQEFRRYGSCGCRSGRKGHKVNPCAAAEEHAVAADAHDRGLPTSITVAAIAAFLERKRCHNHGCNHRGCHETMGVVHWLIEVDRMVKAA